jgi:signal transduction histidine kinase
MARAPGLSARAGAVTARTGESRLWWAAVAVGLALCVAYAVIPVDHVVARDLLVYPLTDLGAVAAVAIGVWLYRPDERKAWLLIAACLLFFMAGDLTWGAYEVAGRSPTASLADVFYLAGYPCLIAGLLIAIRRRSPARDADALIDSAIVGVSAFLLVWVYVVNPYTLSGVGWTEALVSISYPVLDAMVLAAVARLMLGGRWNVTSLRLLLVGLVLTFAGDLAYAANNITHIRLVDTLLQLGIVAIGVAGLHRSMPALTSSSTAPQPASTGTTRLVLLGGVCTVPLMVLAVQAADGDGLHLAALVVGTATLAGLVVARSVGLATRAEQSAQREATLSRQAAELLRTEGRDQLFAVARRTLRELAGDVDARLVGRRGSHALDHGFAFTAPVEVRGELVAELVADGDPSLLHRLSGSLATVAAQLSLALERDRLLDTERQNAEALARRNKELRELDRMKDLFVRGVSHELRTPLTSMIGYIELLRRGDVGELSDDQQRFLEIVERNCHRLADRIDDILFVSQVDRGRLPLERTPVDLGDLAADRVEAIRRVAADKGIEVRVRVDDRSSRLSADGSRLAQLLDNLLSNAVKFTNDGGEIVVAVSTRGENAHVQVDDTGVGIPEDEAGRLFERFFRASTARETPGTGLGLAIAKSIVEAHDGTISVRSRVGVGTTVTVELPLATEPAVPAGPAEEVTA